EAERVVDERVDREIAAVGEEERVSVRLRAGRGLGAEVPSGAWLVVDDDGLPKPLAELLRDDPGQNVVAACRRRGHDPTYRAFWIFRSGLRRGKSRGHGAGDRNRNSDFHGLLPSDVAASESVELVGVVDQDALARRFVGNPFEQQVDQVAVVRYLAAVEV